MRSAVARAVVRRLGARRADEVVADVAPHLRAGERLLDIGAGTGQVAARLIGRGFPVTAVDVRDLSCEPTVSPALVDGRTLPFEDGSFDVALLITVLHHTPDPDAVLAEAARVARRVIVQEDVHASRGQHLATMVMDSVVNLEFFGHPHTNRSDAGWREAFVRHRLRVVASSTKPFWRWFRSATYVLDATQG